MAFPTDIGVVDTMIGFPSPDMKETYRFITRQTKDKESKEDFEFPVEYMFKDNNDNVAGVEMRLPGDLDFADAQTAAETVRAALVPLSNARLYAMAIRKGFYNDDATAIDASSEV